MTIGWKTYQKFIDLNESLSKFGLKLDKPKHDWIDIDTVAVRPLGDDGAPCFSRDAELYSGTLQDVEKWFLGYYAGYNYLKNIKATTDTKIAKCEQLVRNKKLVEELQK